MESRRAGRYTWPRGVHLFGLPANRTDLHRTEFVHPTRINPFTGKVVYKKSEAAQKQLAERIKAIDVDVLALQEVENIEALSEFVDEQRLDDYKHLVLVEGNDERLIDLALISKYPIGAVTSWRHRTYQNQPTREPIFSRDLLQVEILSEQRDRVLFTLFNNHLKSQLARDEAEKQAGDERRRRQAETIADLIRERPPVGPYLVTGDLNDTPDSERLRPR